MGGTFRDEAGQCLQIAVECEPAVAIGLRELVERIDQDLPQGTAVDDAKTNRVWHRCRTARSSCDLFSGPEDGNDGRVTDRGQQLPQ